MFAEHCLFMCRRHSRSFTCTKWSKPTEIRCQGAVTASTWEVESMRHRDYAVCSVSHRQVVGLTPGGVAPEPSSLLHCTASLSLREGQEPSKH